MQLSFSLARGALLLALGLAACGLVDAAGQTPEQIHLAFAGKVAGTGITVSWATTDAVADSTLWLGKAPDALVKADASVQSASYFSEENYSLFQHHATVATGLTPHTTYYYKVGSNSGDAATTHSSVHSFTTARAADDASVFEIAVYGDGGDGPNAVDTIKYVNALGDTVDFVYHIGDISYADNDFLAPDAVFQFGYEQVWNNWTNALAPVMTTKPYMVVVGNHEAECHSPACGDKPARLAKLGNYTAYNARFKMPSTESNGVLNMWHSFEHGPVHFTSISTETDFANAPTNEYTATVKNGHFGDQLAWLETDLAAAAANRAAVPWLVVGMHRPFYHMGDADASGNPRVGSEPRAIQAAFEELFLKYNVDVVLAGHEHSYERNLPTARGQPVLTGVAADMKTYTNPQAPVHIITGAAGNSEGHTFRPTTTAAWSAASDFENYGISKVKVSRTALTWTFVASADGAVLDEFVMTKEPRAVC